MTIQIPGSILDVFMDGSIYFLYSTENMYLISYKGDLNDVHFIRQGIIDKSTDIEIENSLGLNEERLNLIPYPAGGYAIYEVEEEEFQEIIRINISPDDFKYIYNSGFTIPVYYLPPNKLLITQFNYIGISNFGPYRIIQDIIAEVSEDSENSENSDVEFRQFTIPDRWIADMGWGEDFKIKNYTLERLNIVNGNVEAKMLSIEIDIESQMAEEQSAW